jgi:hypothetical protein
MRRLVAPDFKAADFIVAGRRYEVPKCDQGQIPSDARYHHN